VVRASNKVQQVELITRWSAVNLRLVLDRWLWKDASHLSTNQLWEYLCTYGYLPRLRDESVLREAIAEGVRSRDLFAYAASVSDKRYEGLIFCEAMQAANVHLDALSVVVRPEGAAAQQEADERTRKERESRANPPGQQRGGTEVEGPGPSGGPEPPAQPVPAVIRRYHGSAELDPLRISSTARQIADEIVQHLAALPGAELQVTLEIEAFVPDGIPEKVIRDVSENGSTLKLRSQGFEEA
jgi:hypothetical protein